MSSLVTSSPRLLIVSFLEVEREIAYLPGFLEHYQLLGVRSEDMHFVLNAPDADTPALAAAERILAASGAATPQRWIGPYTSNREWTERKALQRHISSPEDWILSAAVDEHHAYPAALTDIAAYCAAKGHSCVQGFVIDRLTQDGSLPPVLHDSPLDRQFPRRGIVSVPPVRWRDRAVRLMLHRGSVLPGPWGHHPSKDSGPQTYLSGDRLRVGSDPRLCAIYPFQVMRFCWTAEFAARLSARSNASGAMPDDCSSDGALRPYLAAHGRVLPGDVLAVSSLPSMAWRTRSAGYRIASSMRREIRKFRPGPGLTVPALPAKARGRDAAADVYVVIRAAGERTEAASMALAAAEVGADKVTTIREAPFSAALRSGLERGHAAGHRWTLCLDADVLLRPGSVADLVAAAERFAADGPILGASGTVADKLLGHVRPAGQHLYRTDLIPLALGTEAFEPDKKRPESYLKEVVADIGHPWVNVELVMGLHDFEQSYVDIFRKVFTHTRKHLRHMSASERAWMRQTDIDPDFRVALISSSMARALSAIGNVQPGPGGGSGLTDRRAYPNDVTALIGLLGLTEKPPLGPEAWTGAMVEDALSTFTDTPEYVASRALVEASLAARRGQVLARLRHHGAIAPVWLAGVALQGAGNWLRRASGDPEG